MSVMSVPGKRKSGNDRPVEALTCCESDDLLTASRSFMTFADLPSEPVGSVTRARNASRITNSLILSFDRRTSNFFAV